MLWIRTHARQYKDIFFVTHSMGGLLVRDACARLALSSDVHDLALFSKIKHCFLIASPVGGAVWAKRFAKIPLLCKLNSHLAYLSQEDQYLSRFPTYEDAIEKSKVRGGGRPKFSIFTGTCDRVVQEILESALTEDDTYEGPVPGTHASLKSALTPNSTLVKRIVQIVSDYSRREVVAPRLSTPAISSTTNTAAAAVAENTALGGKPIILISCSAHKRTDLEVLHPKKGGVLSAIANGEIALRAIQTRAQIMGLLQSGKIDGTEYKEGNRAGRPENRALILGPDFGGAINEPRYLPAYWRYSGRTYLATKDEWVAFSNSPTFGRASHQASRRHLDYPMVTDRNWVPARSILTSTLDGYSPVRLTVNDLERSGRVGPLLNLHQKILPKRMLASLYPDTLRTESSLPCEWTSSNEPSARCSTEQVCQTAACSKGRSFGSAKA